MMVSFKYREHLQLATFVGKWIAICLPLGVAVGSAVAFFLWSLDQVTQLHWRSSRLLYLLPVAGLVSGLMYHRWGGAAKAGNNLILDEIHQPTAGVPLRMTPLVLIGTLLTHLCGGSAGREGTAVQMAGGLAGSWCRFLRLSTDDTRLLLMSGVAAGFGAVFGTPLTGAIFAVEVSVFDRIRYRALIPCLIAGIVGDQVTMAWGVGHTDYHIVMTEQISDRSSDAALDWLLTGKVMIAAAAFGLGSMLFTKLTHGISRVFKRIVTRCWLRPVVGGCVVILMVWILGKRDYLGLGVEADPQHPKMVTIQTCFQPGGAEWLSWLWKILFTAVTVGSGFKGGEVTPLFFIGAALGNVLGHLLGAPVDLLAGLGLVAVFAGATNTPLASTIMAIELFGTGNSDLLNSGFVIYAATACFLSYLFSGHSSIYGAKRIDLSKSKLVGEESPQELSIT